MQAYAYGCKDTWRSELLVPLELESEAVLSCPMWVLGIKLEASARAASVLMEEPSIQPLPPLLPLFNDPH